MQVRKPNTKIRMKQSVRMYLWTLEESEMQRDCLC